VPAGSENGVSSSSKVEASDQPSPATIAGSNSVVGGQPTVIGAARSGSAVGTDAVAQVPTASAAGAINGSKLAVSAEDALRRMRLLQEYLCAYEAQGLPVVKVSYGNFGEALDKLHEYILQCIKVAMESSV